MAQAYQDTFFAYQGAGELAYQYPVSGIGPSLYGVAAGSGISADKGEVLQNARGVGGIKAGSNMDGVEGIAQN